MWDSMVGKDCAGTVSLLATMWDSMVGKAEGRNRRFACHAVATSHALPYLQSWPWHALAGRRQRAL